jgi:DNA-binding response OmpR family regulator
MKTILVIDDEFDIRDLIKDILEFHEFKVCTAQNGKDGIITAVKEKPDLIICDIMMPEMDGFEVLKIIRSDTTMGLIPFIFLTAKTETTDLRKGMNQGADDYIFKPFDAEVLINAVKSRLLKAENVQKELSQKLDKFYNQVMTIATHEYNTPLNGILGASELALQYFNTFTKEELYKFVELIHEAGKRLYRHTRNMVLLNEIMYSPDSLNSNFHIFKGEVLKCEENILTVSDEVAKKHKRFDDLSVEIEDARIDIDEKNFNVILEELLDNAFKFSVSGNKVALIAKPIEKEFVITISDSGRGFVENTLNQLAPFKQFGREKHEQQGFGLGLFLSLKLIELFNGTYKIDSQLEKGTTVTIKFPLCKK